MTRVDWPFNGVDECETSSIIGDDKSFIFDGAYKIDSLIGEINACNN